MDTIAQRTCVKCGITKNVEDFYKQPARKDGLNSKCKICVIECTKEYQRTHLKDRRESYVRHRTKRIEASKKYYREHIDECRAYKKSYKKRYRVEKSENYKAERKRRRLLESALEVRFTQEEWKSLCEAVSGKCLCCGKESKLVPDHVIPLSKGGTGDIGNIQPLCSRCNSLKGTKSTDYRNAY